jgi:signal transduction histidine kinase
LATRSNLRRRDELGALAASFDQMADGLQKNIHERDRAEKALYQLNKDLERRVEDRTAELRQAQEELLRKERFAAIGQITGTVSHELRNPLGTIRTSMFMIDEKVRGKGLGVERALDRVQRSIERCNGIIGDLLDYTRVPELDPEPTPIDDWLERSLASHAVVALDRERFLRVVINLVENACQAMTDHNRVGGEGRELRLTVTSDRVERGVEISFADTGPGIAADVLPRVFEPLYSTKSFGVGLGLPTVKQIVEQHGGTVDIGSAAGEGSRVVVRLPLNAERKEKEA